MNTEYLRDLLRELLTLQEETEWVELKHNYAEPQDIGEYLSALSNSAALLGMQSGYIVWGIEDKTHDVVGTSFRPRKAKVGKQELENWLVTQLNPRIYFKIHEFVTNTGKHVVLFEVPRATHMPVQFKGVEYIRSGSYKKKLKEFPDKERELWALFHREPFEACVALENITADDVLGKIDYPTYFDLTEQKLPDNREGILDRLVSEKIVNAKPGGVYDITNLGGILFAKYLDEFDRLKRKAIRVVIYKGNNRIETVREQTGGKGYAVGFEGAISFINNQLPENEEIGPALRKKVRMYPEIAIRELAANAIIHQDFSMTGTGPMIEIFTDRIEITNPGEPLIDTLRFIDGPPQSHNEALAAFMRRINICEERGSGVDKVIFHAELYQLPAPEFTVAERHTRAVLFAHKKLADMSKSDRNRACYQHACLRHVSNDIMTNSSLRERFSIEDKNYAMASRIIADTIAAGLIRRHDPESKSRKHAKYVPFWA